MAAFEHKVESVINAGRGSGMINSDSGSDLTVFLRSCRIRMQPESSGSELLSSWSDRTHTLLFSYVTVRQGRTQGGCTGCTCIPPTHPVHSPPPLVHVHPPPFPNLKGWLWEKVRQWTTRKKCKFVYLNIIIFYPRFLRIWETLVIKLYFVRTEAN